MQRFTLSNVKYVIASNCISFQVLLNELVKDRMNAFKIVCEETFPYIHIRFNTPTDGFQHQEYTED